MIFEQLEREQQVLVGLPENGDLFRRLMAEYAGPRAPLLFGRDATQSGLGGFLDLFFALAIAAPIGLGKAGFNGQAELFEIFRLQRMRVAEGESAVKERLLNFNQQLLRRRGNAVLGGENLPFAARFVATCQYHGSFGERPWDPAPCAEALHASPSH